MPQVIGVVVAETEPAARRGAKAVKVYYEVYYEALLSPPSHMLVELMMCCRSSVSWSQTQSPRLGVAPRQ